MAFWHLSKKKGGSNLSGLRSHHATRSTRRPYCLGSSSSRVSSAHLSPRAPSSPPLAPPPTNRPSPTPPFLTTHTLALAAGSTAHGLPAVGSIDDDLPAAYLLPPPPTLPNRPPRPLRRHRWSSCRPGPPSRSGGHGGSPNPEPSTLRPPPPPPALDGDPPSAAPPTNHRSWRR
jgi:hypothetical protein